MRFYTQQHQAYGGIDLPARSLSGCILSQDGEIRLHRTMKTSPETWLKAIAPYREARVGAVEWILTWYGLADRCAQEQMPVVRGHALSMQAIHGGQAKHDQIDSQQLAVLRRGGRLPQADVYPAAMRAPRDLLRRRRPLTRKRAEMLAPIQHTNSQDHLPELGKKLASKANRAGVAERFPDPAVHKRMEVDRGLIGYYDQGLNDRE